MTASIPDPTKATPAGFCGCGCGEEVARRYRPGHDARHKGALLVAARGTDTRLAERAAWQMLDAGWGRYLDDEILQALPFRHRGKRRHHIDGVERFLVAPSGLHHANAACPCLTDEARKAGQVHPLTKLARPGFCTLVDGGPLVAQRLRTSWDVCQACLAEETPLEMVERTLIRQWLALEALDLEFPNAKKDQRKREAQHKALIAAGPYEVQPDTGREPFEPFRLEWVA